MNKKNLLHIYALLVCFFTIIILIITLSFSLNSITNLLIPEYKYYSTLSNYNSNESFLQQYESVEEKPSPQYIALKQLSPAQLDEKRLRERKEYLEDQRVSNITTLVSMFQWILVALIFFFIHWRFYKKSK